MTKIDKDQKKVLFFCYIFTYFWQMCSVIITVSRNTSPEGFSHGIMKRKIPQELFMAIQP